MSQSTSPSTHQPYGVATVATAWHIPRSTFYAVKASQQRPDAAPAKRGPKTKHSDAELTDLIRQEITASPFHGEGHRKIWARLRYHSIRTSKPRVLRLMRQAQLLAPSRRAAMPEVEHTGHIITACPNQVWGTDGTMTMTLQDGNVTVFAAIDHCSADCVGKSARVGKVVRVVPFAITHHLGTPTT